MAKNIHHTYVVEGRGEFPFDMLRREDSAFHGPVPADLGRIRKPVRVKLATTYDRPEFWLPLDARWRSFGWKVVEVNGEPFDGDTLMNYPSKPTQDTGEYAEAYEAMLDALKNLRSAFMAHTNWAGDLPAEIVAADKAIAKAEGK